MIETGREAKAAVARSCLYIPGVHANQLLARVGYEQATGLLAGLGAHVETVFQDDFFIDKANLLKAPATPL